MPKAKANGININYKAEGQVEPLIMISGFNAERWTFLFQTRAFKKYYRVITFDNRGVGKTDKPDRPYTIKMMADDTIGLMDYLDIDKAHILGHSMGGMIAQELAINYPDRVKKLMLASTHANMKIAMDEITNISPEIPKTFESIGRSNTSNIQARSTFLMCTFNNNKWLLKMILPLLVRISLFRNGTKGLIGQKEALKKHDTLDRLHMIEAPTLVITGTADRLVSPSSSEVLASQIPNAKLVKIENGSHGCPVEMRGRFNQEVLDFLMSS